MSYDLYVVDSDGQTMSSDTPHSLCGGTFAVGGTTELWLNMTYNYVHILRRVLGEDGIRTLDEMSTIESIPLLERAIGMLEQSEDIDMDVDYWQPSDSNVRRALLDVLALAKLGANGTWRVT